MDDDEAVPHWCEFFSVEEYLGFCAAVDEAAGMYGADGQELDDGTVWLAAGEPIELHGFDLGHLARRCREHPREEREKICERQVMAWVEGGTQRAWLDAAAFDDVADRLMVWFTGQPKVLFRGDPEGPKQPFSVPVADNLHASLLATVPPTDGAPAVPVYVPNSAVQAWGRTVEDLLDAARRNLMRLPPPDWETRAGSIVDDAGEVVATVDVYVGTPVVDAPGSSWLLVLDEVAPVPLDPWAMVAVPTRQRLVLTPLSADDDLLRGDQITAVYHHADAMHDEASDQERVSPQKYVYWPSGEIVSAREYWGADDGAAGQGA